MTELSQTEFQNVVEKLIEAAKATCPVTGASDAANAVATVLCGFIGVEIISENHTPLAA